MSSGRILVTGANGFIAAYCIAELFAQKYAVVATVRSADKVAAVLAAHGHNPLLTTAIVPDLTRPDAFDDAITGCDGVLHLASPFTYDCTDVEAELLLPSIRGTEAICLAASKTPSVQRVVLTSSFAAVFDAAAGLAPGRVYTAQDWSPLTYEDGKAASDAPPVAYRASKKLAEDAAWQYVKRHQPHWDLVTLCPGMVFGPLWPGTLSSLGRLNESNSIIWGLVDAAAVPATKAPRTCPSREYINKIKKRQEANANACSLDRGDRAGRGSRGGPQGPRSFQRPLPCH